MEIQKFKSIIESWPRNRRGRLIFTNSMRSEVQLAFTESGLTVHEFTVVTGLKLPTVVKILKNLAPRRRMRVPRAKSSALFQSVKVVSAIETQGWSICGPRGLEVKCRNLSQVTELWKALC